MMGAPDWERVKRVFQEVLDEPPHQRMVRAREMCGDDSALLAEVESLLASHAQAGTFAEYPEVELLNALPIEETGRGLEAFGAVLQAGDRLGAYEIQTLIGAGGMGDVYQARDTRLDRTVAIKVLRAHGAGHERLRDRFQREARAVAALSHPHICTLYDVGHQDGVDFLVMEHLAGETLAARLARGPLPLEQALDLAIEIAAALGAAHRAGIVHRDLKPGNVFLVRSRSASGSPNSKLLDFGLAKRATSVPDRESPHSSAPGAPTTVGAILGTVQYMAPEQLEGNAADARTDVFAFGAVLFEMMAGRKAFEGRSQASLIAAILEHEPPALSSIQPVISPALSRIVATCLAKDPDDRWQTARDLQRELAWARNGDAGTRTATVTARRPWLRALAWSAAAMIAALAGTAIYVSRRQATTDGHTVRFSIYPPPGTTFPRGTAEMAVSPDGSRLVFVALGSDSVQRLWVRRFDSVSARPLDGTDNASYPFWSPDGRSIGFFASGKLRRIGEAGGAVQVLCNAVFPRGGTWNRDGIILFGGSGPIQRIADTGGVATPATTLDATRKERTHLWPVFLPDGHSFLYLARSQNQEQTGIYQRSLDSAETHRVLANVSNVSPAAQYLFALSNRSLVAYPYDADRGKVVGEPIAVADQISLDAPERSGSAFASSTRVLAYRSSSPESHLVWFDRAGQELGAFREPGDYHHPSLAPDDRRVAIEKTDSGTGYHTIWAVEPDRGVVSRLVYDPFGAHQPVWSSDGTRVAFSSNRLGGIDMYSTAADGTGGEELLLSSSKKESMVPTDWSRDGRYLLYELGQRPSDLWILPVSPVEKPWAFLATPSNERHGQFSPDVRWVAYMSDESGTQEVYVRRFPGGEGKWRVSTNGGAQPQWRRDGKELFYLAPDGKLMTAAIRATVPGFETDAPQVLFNTGIRGTLLDRRNHYVAAGDGRRFLVNISAEDENPAPITVVLNWEATLKK